MANNTNLENQVNSEKINPKLMHRQSAAYTAAVVITAVGLAGCPEQDPCCDNNAPIATITNYVGNVAGTDQAGACQGVKLDVLAQDADGDALKAEVNGHPYTGVSQRILPETVRSEYGEMAFSILVQGTEKLQPGTYNLSTRIWDPCGAEKVLHYTVTVDKDGQVNVTQPNGGNNGGISGGNGGNFVPTPGYLLNFISKDGEMLPSDTTTATPYDQLFAGANRGDTARLVIDASATNVRINLYKGSTSNLAGLTPLTDNGATVSSLTDNIVNGDLLNKQAVIALNQGWSLDPIVAEVKAEIGGQERVAYLTVRK